MARLIADLAIGEIEDNQGDKHYVSVAVLVGPGGIVWQSKDAWGVGPGSALAGARTLDDLRGDIIAQWGDMDIDWSVLAQIREDLE